jgi:cardiolipin synthase
VSAMKEDKIYKRMERFRDRRSRASDSKVVKIKTEHNGMSMVKFLLTLALVFLQLGIIISLNFFFAIGFKWYIAILAIVSVITAVSVLSSHRSGQAKAVWVLFILVCFEFGFVIYFMSNDKIMYRKSRKRHRKIYARTEKYVTPYVQPNASDDVLLNCRYLYNSGGFVPYTNSRVKYFPYASALFDDVLENLKSAEKFVFMEFFAITDGVLLNRVLSILEDKMREGVTVRIIYDDVGSRDLSLKMRKRIRKAGGEIKVFNRLLSRFTFALNYRDHRKIIVIDGEVAYTGGSNLADEYINEKRMYGYWKDTGLKIEGDAVDGMTISFLRQWEFIVKKEEDYVKYLNYYRIFPTGGVVLPYVGGPEFEHSVCKNVYENVISGAREKLYIMTPYFVPDDSLTQDIINAALSGVDVRIVLPSVPDKFYVYLLTKDNAEKLIKYGVKVYYVEDCFVHSKALLTEKCAVVGSVNFDMRSFYQQFENSVLSDDEGVRADLEKDFNNAFDDSVLMQKPQKNGIFKSVLITALRIVAPLM